MIDISNTARIQACQDYYRPVAKLEAVAAYYGYAVRRIRDGYPTFENPTRFSLHNENGDAVATGSPIDLLAWFAPDSIKRLRDDLIEWVGTEPRA